MGENDTYDVLGSENKFTGNVIEVRVDDVRMSDGKVVQREIVTHPGAGAIVALDDDGKVVLGNQYPHPVPARLAEPTAGLLDVAGEPALIAAQRELAEETGLAAEEWHVLVDLYSSPGMTDEAVRIFLARGLRPAGGDFQPEHEEITMHVFREPLSESVRRVLNGSIVNASAVAGILAA